MNLFLFDLFSLNENVFSGDVQLKEELINSSWCGVLAAMSLLLDAR